MRDTFYVSFFFYLGGGFSLHFLNWLVKRQQQQVETTKKQILGDREDLRHEWMWMWIRCQQMQQLHQHHLLRRSEDAGNR